jgi:hypothetical protein
MQKARELNQRKAVFKGIVCACALPLVAGTPNYRYRSVLFEV